MTRIAADVACVSRHRAKLQPHARKDSAVSVIHRLVARACTGFVTIERVCILHREFAPSHQTETRAPLIAKLGLNVIEIQRQLLVAADQFAHDIGDHFFAGRLDDEVTLVPVFQPQHLRTHFLPPARFDPQLGRLHDRHQQLDRAGAVHLLANDRLDLANAAQTDRHVGVDTGCQAPDHSGAQHQRVADHLGIGRRFFKGGKEKLARAHSVATL